MEKKALRGFLCLLVLILLVPESYAQTQDTIFIRQDHEYDDTLKYETDTIVFASGMTKHILIGTAVLPSTRNQLDARTYGLYLNKVIKSNCKRDADKYLIQDKINAVVQTDTSLIVDITFSDNCCYDFLCDMSVDSNGTIKILYHGYGTNCACNCCFGLTYFFTIEKDPEYQPIKGVMINEDKKTTKLLNK